MGSFLAAQNVSGILKYYFQELIIIASNFHQQRGVEHLSHTGLGDIEVNETWSLTSGSSSLVRYIVLILFKCAMDICKISKKLYHYDIFIKLNKHTLCFI